ncbi:TenA family protein [Actinomadura roseirufa]|uniref:TenA family protein n=1 Tax=Actinomadura roseirufa TaxID=2094049 RepID=UPI001041377F|nr:TenA family transcriptional regulator [Actinomadura roseirufa]
MLHDELKEIRDPVLRKVQDHPFWSGLRDGSLPGEALARFVQQDTGHLLPAYARALARCAAQAPDDADAALFGQSVVGTLEAAGRLRQAYRDLSGALELPELGEQTPADPATHAHASFFVAAGARSFYDGVGALLPMVWFNAEVSDELRRSAKPGSRYLPWIEVYHPGEGYKYAVQAFLDMADRAGEGSPGRRRIIEQFSISVRYEWAFAECCLHPSPWPV